jgi:hypothetical protein
MALDTAVSVSACLSRVRELPHPDLLQIAVVLQRCCQP